MTVNTSKDSSKGMYRQYKSICQENNQTPLGYTSWMEAGQPDFIVEEQEQEQEQEQENETSIDTLLTLYSDIFSDVVLHRNKVGYFVQVLVWSTPATGKLPKAEWVPIGGISEDSKTCLLLGMFSEKFTEAMAKVKGTPTVPTEDVIALLQEERQRLIDISGMFPPAKEELPVEDKLEKLQEAIASGEESLASAIESKNYLMAAEINAELEQLQSEITAILGEKIESKITDIAPIELKHEIDSDELNRQLLELVGKDVIADRNGSSENNADLQVSGEYLGIRVANEGIKYHAVSIPKGDNRSTIVSVKPESITLI
jgi:hypothetical protein